VEDKYPWEGIRLGSSATDPSEFLNTLTPNGLPPHVLKLKIRCPVILLRNIVPAGELCNGARLMVRGFQRNTIDAEIMVGDHAGK
jgi:ATP-dependent DNA helicase PIF1